VPFWQKEMKVSQVWSTSCLNCGYRSAEAHGKPHCHQRHLLLLPSLSLQRQLLQHDIKLSHVVWRGFTCRWTHADRLREVQAAHARQTTPFTWWWVLLPLLSLVLLSVLQEDGGRDKAQARCWLPI
jgi:hypothetical protein